VAGGDLPAGSIQAGTQPKGMATQNFKLRQLLSFECCIHGFEHRKFSSGHANKKPALLGDRLFNVLE
jgi:hypothetical protein